MSAFINTASMKMRRLMSGNRTSDLALHRSSAFGSFATFWVVRRCLINRYCLRVFFKPQMYFFKSNGIKDVFERVIKLREHIHQVFSLIVMKS